MTACSTVPAATSSAMVTPADNSREHPMYLVLPDGSWVVGPDEANAREAVAGLTHEHWNLSLDKRLYFGADDDDHTRALLR